jgi:hypothetical protein
MTEREFIELVKEYISVTNFIHGEYGYHCHCCDYAEPDANTYLTKSDELYGMIEKVVMPYEDDF